MKEKGPKPNSGSLHIFTVVLNRAVSVYQYILYHQMILQMDN